MPTTDTLISEADIHARIRTLAAEIEHDYPAGDGVHLVAILKGGFMFMADLVRAMSDRVTMDFMAVSSYGKGTTSSARSGCSRISTATSRAATSSSSRTSSIPA